jgi:hypothetical protein
VTEPTRPKRAPRPKIRAYHVVVEVPTELEAVIVPRRGSIDYVSLSVDLTVNPRPLLQLDLGDRAIVTGPIDDYNAVAVVRVVAIERGGWAARCRSEGGDLRRCAGEAFAMKAKA